MALVRRIVSGGQSGADRASLDLAIRLGIPHGGWCPRGRKAEDGLIHRRYRLRETPSAGYAQRTEWNVRDSDGTVIFSLTNQLTGGSKKTLQFGRKYGRPCLHLVAAQRSSNHADLLCRFVKRHHIRVLNIAGPRKSEEPRVGSFVTRTLRQALKRLPAAVRADSIATA